MQQGREMQVFREDTEGMQQVVKKSKAVLTAARRLHLHIAGGMPGTRLRKQAVEENIERLKAAIAQLEGQLAQEKLNTDERGELTFF